MPYMSVTLDTSHAPTAPCLEQSPFGDNFRHASTALLSLGLECGENAGGGAGWEPGEIVGLSFKFWESYNESTSRCILYEVGFGFGQDSGCAFAYAPPLQESGEMLTRSIKSRIQSREGKRICACWFLT